MKTQTQNILEYLQAGGSISQATAYHLFGCWRLGARIFDLRRQGHMIETHFVTRNKKTFAEYRLYKP